MNISVAFTFAHAANILVSASAHTNVAYYYFKNGNGGNVPILPLYSQIKASVSVRPWITAW